MVCFVHFDFEMCFAPQRRALFRHLNFQKHSETEVFSTFWLGHVLRATTACKFSSLIWPDGSARAALASLLFDNRSHKPLEKHSESWLVYLFAHLHLLSSHSFSSLIFSLLLFSSLTLRTSVFPSVHIVGSLTSKLPSAIHGYTTSLESTCLSRWHKPKHPPRLDLRRDASNIRNIPLSQKKSNEDCTK